MNKQAKIYSELKTSLAELRNIIFPASCAGCGEPCLSEKTLCAKCYNKLNFLSAYKCRQCGYEAEHLMNDICGNCLQKTPYFEQFYGVVSYDDFAASLVGRLKFGDHLNIVPIIGQLMAASLDDIEPSTIVTPVPLHWRRRIKRRFNQSAELSRYIGKAKGLQYIPSLVQRIKATKPQIGQSGYQRQQNLKNAFRFNPKYSTLNKGQILLVDDVLTTGSTAQSVAKILKRQGFSVSLVVFARVEGHLR